MAKYDIFISYRREGGYDTAKHLYDLLSRDGYKVSFDIDTLRNGDVDKSLLNRIDECKDFILIVDSHAFDRTLNPNFNPNKDWLRQELAYALKKGKNIVPIMLNGFSFPDNLPEDISQVTIKNGPQYNKYYFNEFYNKLVTQFLTSKKEVNKIGSFWILCSVILSLSFLIYSLNHENKVNNGGLTVFTIFSLIYFVILIIGYSRPSIIMLKSRGVVNWYILPFLLSIMSLGIGSTQETQIQSPVINDLTISCDGVNWRHDIDVSKGKTYIYNISLTNNSKQRSEGKLYLKHYVNGKLILTNGGSNIYSDSIEYILKGNDCRDITQQIVLPELNKGLLREEIWMNGTKIEIFNFVIR